MYLVKEISLEKFDKKEETSSSLITKVHDYTEGIAKNGSHWTVYCGNALDVLKTLPANTFDCVVTSPPYFSLRDYHVEGQIGKEDTIEEYICNLALVMDEVYRVLSKTGVMFLNIGETYYSGKGESKGSDSKNRKRRFGVRAVDKSGGLGIGLQRKSAIGVPWRVAWELSQRKWVLRSSIIWVNKSRTPETVKDRPRQSYENIFMFTKNRKYYFNRQPLIDAGEEDVWVINARPKSKGLDTAPYPDELVERCLAIGCPPTGKVLDPFAGSGTTLRVAISSSKHATGIDINNNFSQYTTNQLINM
jgi:DNA modification methylase